MADEQAEQQDKPQLSEVEKRRATALEAVKPLVEYDVARLVTRLQEHELPTGGGSAIDGVNEIRRLGVSLQRLIEQTASEDLLTEARNVASQLWSPLSNVENANADQRKDRLKTLGEALRSGLEEPIPGQNRLGLKREARVLTAYGRIDHFDEEGIQALVADIKARHEEATAAAQEVLAMLKQVENAQVKWTNTKAAAQFEASAVQHRAASRWFLGFGIGTFTIANAIVGMAAWGGFAVSDADPLARTIARAVLVSLISTLSFVFLRGYRTNSHLAVTNSHRATVLKTYNAIVSAAEDTDTRMALLREAADCIFQGGQTGYLGDKEFRIDEQIVSLLRDTVSKKAGGA